MNLADAHATGRTEYVLVGLKVLILLFFGVGGLSYGYTTGQLTAGLANVGVGPLLASAIAFVAFEGWELLFFDQTSIADPERTVRRAVYVPIVAATALYVVVAVVTTNLLDPSTIRQNAETSLALAARPFLGSAGFLLVGVAALFSTASALNATLFSAARLSRDLVDEDFLQAHRGSDALEERGWEEPDDVRYEELGEEGHGSSDIDQKIRAYRIIEEHLGERMPAAETAEAGDRDERFERRKATYSISSLANRSTASRSRSALAAYDRRA